MDRKEDQVRRYLKSLKHQRTRDERKELERRSRERKADATRRPRGKKRRRDWLEEGDEELDFESIPKSPRYRSTAFRQAARDALVDASAPAPADDDVGTGPDAAGPEGVVVSVAPGRARVLVDGSHRDTVLADAIARTQKASLAVGDEVVLEERDGAEPRVVAVRPRRSFLSRPDPSRPGVERVLAANVDRAVVVVSVRRPAFRPRLVDRYLVALQRGGVEPVVCANKVDLVLDEHERAGVERQLDEYRALGVPALATSGLSGDGLDELRELLDGRTVVFVGQSGVGKSSLLNALAPGLGLVTGAVREGDGKGRHTTTTSTLLDLGRGTRWIDTPGIRSFALADVTRASLPGYFPDLVEHAGACRFRDCSHVHEPECAVRAAVERGELSPFRYDTYRRLLDSLDA